MALPPQPPPIARGEPVAPALLAWLEHNARVRELVAKRHAFGMRKYGQPLMTEDGRDTVRDALEEAGDLLQYTFKARMRGGRELRELREQLPEVLECIKRMLM